jgi:parallel beta-helix repeat protein
MKPAISFIKASVLNETKKTMIHISLKRAGLFVLILGVFGIVSWASGAETFVHPGLLQTREDLTFMKQKIAAGEEPWKTAWSNLCSESYSSLDFKPKPVAHVVRGPYGRPSIGDKELTESANAAYSQALQWVVTGDKVHAQNAIDILNAWSGTLWDFEDNDAKLLAAWTGHAFCNAAEILRYTDSGWKEKDVAQFKRMLLTVYYPLIKDYFPEANGNWDAAMMDTTLCIGIYCDDRAIFDSAVSHFRRGEGNGGITKYIYPSGQCEESTRDQAHTQLGLGELAQACQIAWNQKVDIYGAADNRLALGFEYTAKYMLGEEVPSYGIVSTQARGRFSDIYEGVNQHYHFVKGLGMPFTERALEKTRAGRGWSTLTTYHGPVGKSQKNFGSPRPARQASQAGALAEPTATAPTNAITVAPGDSVQAAIDTASTNSSCVLLATGIHVLPAALRLPSGMTLAGQGRETILILDPQVTQERAGVAIVNGTDDLHDVTLRDFVVEGATIVCAPTNTFNLNYEYSSGSGSGVVSLRPLTNDPNQDRRQRSYQMSPSRAGIIFNSQHEGQMHNLRFEHITVRNCTHNGVAIRGAARVSVIACDFSDNGSSVVPGPGLQDNLLLSHVTGCRISDSRLDTSPWGSGLELSFGSGVTITNNETARNARNGIHVTESHDVRICENLAEGNDRDGIAANALMDGCHEIKISGNLSRNNGDRGIEVDHATGGLVEDNSVFDNGNVRQLSVTASKAIHLSRTKFSNSK